MYRTRGLAAAAILTAAAGLLGADGPAGDAAAPMPDAAPALSPAVAAALKDLSAEDYKTRQAALLKLEMTLGEQMRSLTASDDPEVQSRLTELLQFNDGLTRWVLDAMKLPAAQRKAQLDYGLNPVLLPIMANLFSVDVSKRVEGVKALGKQNSEEATAILTRLLDDPERAVYVAAMEALWDKKPTDAVVDALWDRAVESGFAGGRQQSFGRGMVATPNVVFRGRVLNGGVTYMGGVFPGQDAEIACDVLINLKAPQVPGKLQALAPSLEKMEENNPWMMMNFSEQMKNVQRLLAAYHANKLLAVFYRIATGPMRQSNSVQNGGEKFFWSNRTGALATVVEATGQKPEDYQLRRSARIGEAWTVPTQDDENAVIKKLQEWMAANGEKYGIKETAQPVQEGAETQPGPAHALPKNMPLKRPIPNGIPQAEPARGN